MAVAEVAEVIALPFTAYIAEAGETFPKLNQEETEFTSGVSGGAGWKLLGKSGSKNYSEAGVTVTHTQAQAQFVSAGGIVPRKKWRTEEGMTVAFELVDLSPVTYGRILDEAKPLEAKITSKGKTITQWGLQLKRGGTGVGPGGFSQSIKIHFYALMLRGVSTLNENLVAQYQIPACCQSGQPAPKFSLKQGPAMLAVQFDVLEFISGEWAEYVAAEKEV